MSKNPLPITFGSDVQKFYMWVDPFGSIRNIHIGGQDINVRGQGYSFDEVKFYLEQHGWISRYVGPDELSGSEYYEFKKS